MTRWSIEDIPNQTGRTVVITGATSGVGQATAQVLADKGARIVIGARNLAKAEEVVPRLGDNAEARMLDLADLDSVRAFAEAWHDPIDILINNAGVMAVPLTRTAQGFELQFGTNHLGHFAFTGLLLERLLPVRNSRVVTVSSGAHRIRAAIHFDDLQWEKAYSRVGAYGQSKLANLLFTYELQRRLIGAQTIALAAHPGGSNTELSQNSPALIRPILDIVFPLITQDAAGGALPTLRAATDPGALGGQYYGPDGLAEMRGNPKVVASSAQSHDTDVQRRLWAVSEELTGVVYPDVAEVAAPSRQDTPSEDARA